MSPLPSFLPTVGTAVNHRIIVPPRRRHSLAPPNDVTKPLCPSSTFQSRSPRQLAPSRSLSLCHFGKSNKRIRKAEHIRRRPPRMYKFSTREHPAPHVHTHIAIYSIAIERAERQAYHERAVALRGPSEPGATSCSSERFQQQRGLSRRCSGYLHTPSNEPEPVSNRPDHIARPLKTATADFP